MPVLSIITINYNNLPGLQKTMESVFCQSFTDYEYIIIDGGSSDGSKELIEKYANRLNYWVSEKDGGVYNAMNKGIPVAKGDYLLFLNSGDYLFSNSILENVFCDNPTVDILYGNIKWITDGIQTDGVFPSDLTFSYFTKNSLPHQATFIKRDLFDKIGRYDETYKITSDWIFFILAIYKYNCSYKHLSLVISVCDRHGISCAPENWPLILAERKSVIELHFRAFQNDFIEIEKETEALKAIKRSYKALEKNYAYRFLKKIKKSFKLLYTCFI